MESCRRFVPPENPHPQIAGYPVDEMQVRAPRPMTTSTMQAAAATPTGSKRERKHPGGYTGTRSRTCERLVRTNGIEEADNMMMAPTGFQS